MEKRKISARELATDVRAGLDDAALMEKYGLAAQGLQSVFRKLVDAKVIQQSELDSRGDSTQRTVDPVWQCPSCGKYQMQEFDECPECGVFPSKFKEQEERKREAQHIAEAARLAREAQHADKEGELERLPKVSDNLPWLFVAAFAVGMVLALGATTSSPVGEDLVMMLDSILTVTAMGLLYYDRGRLRQLGYDTRRLNVWSLVFPPVYLHRRARLTRGSLGPFFSCVLIVYLQCVTLLSLSAQVK